MSAKLFGLTGGIGSGKSTVTKLFEAEGVSMIDADLLARQVVERGQPALRKLLQAFGSEILCEDGTLDRPKLAAIVFTDKAKRRQLDDIMMPFILMTLREEVIRRQKEAHLVGLDAPLLIETGLHAVFRPLIVVSVSEDTQVRRVMDRDGLTEPEARARISAQMPLREKVALANYVIHNNGSLEELREQALSVLGSLKS